jgi:hypothetical protein
MGLPADDYLAGVPGVSRIAALRLAGNGVVPLHAETALRELARRALIPDPGSDPERHAH